MRKSFLILVVAAVTFTACEKSDQAQIDPANGLKTSILQKHGADDGLSGGGQDDRTITVPPKVLSAFVKYFDTAKVREWRLTSKGLYKAHFLRNGVAWEASFKADGTLVKSERA